MQDERVEIFRGHTEECLQNYSLLFSKKTQKNSLIVIADFCSVSTGTVKRWLSSEGLPVGETLMKLMCFLDAIGYSIIELERMPKVQRGFIELIAFGFFSGKEAADAIGYSTASSLYQVLQGNGEPGKEKSQKMWEIWKEKKEELNKKKEEKRRIFEADIRPGNFGKETFEIEDSNYKEKATIKIMESLIYLLQENAFEEPEDIGEVTGIIFRLSSHLNSLSARLTKKIIENQKG
ncbi:MAG: hypothetical protein PHS29_03090 [Candidatus Pacebacteria bacterium]|nr:hypothetical protein [Candidatus Paceibacterota bacterium]MDD4897587.1 hypothetical protein [Candidatus Paceibacterota bacterium]